MRELFDEVAGQSPLDPQEKVRRAARTPQRKRFYT
ncbi:MAG: ATPase, partial [Bradyrhizobium sp.]